jgi:hypothetical protein
MHNHHSSIGSGIGFGFQRQSSTIAAEGLQRRKRLSTALSGDAKYHEVKPHAPDQRASQSDLPDIDDVSMDFSADLSEETQDAKSILAESLQETSNVLDDIFSSALDDMKR